jgi:nicotinamidase/pyrazinamidase
MAAPTVLKAGEYNLLIIDPQVDFHEGGNLAVAGATADSIATAALIRAIKPAKVFVSLDTHTPMHIGHSLFWKEITRDADGTALDVRVDGKQVNPPMYTFFSYKPGKVYSLQNRQGEEVEVEYLPVREELTENVYTYFENLKALNESLPPTEQRGFPLIWPNHCLENTRGHKVHAGLKAALDELGQENVEYHIKGQNEAAEMYSIFKAEVEAAANVYTGKFNNMTDDSKITTAKSDEPDHAYLSTAFNEKLYNKLVANGLPIVVCGQALSHCVNWSTRDLNEKRKVANSDAKIILIENLSSMVQLPGDDKKIMKEKAFGPNTTAFIDYCRGNGVEVTTVEAASGGVVTKAAQVGGRRRGRRAPTRRNRRYGKRRATRHRRR